MRRRSNTLHESNFNDFLNASQRPDNSHNPSFKLMSKRVPKFSSKDNAIIYENAAQDSLTNHQNKENIDHLDTMILNRKKKVESNANYWDNFDFENDDTFEENGQNKDGLSGASSLAFSENTADTDCSEETDGGKGIPSTLKRIMVIGLNNSGKWSLINSTFDCADCRDPNDEKNHQVMDLLTKTEVNDGGQSEIRYQFWIRNLYNQGANQGRFEELIKTYYKNVSLFLFVYSVSNKDSFACLNNEISKILNQVPADKLKCALLGTKGDLDDTNRQVDYFDGVSLQEKYKLTCFMETSQEDHSLKEKLIRLLNETDLDSAEVERRKKDSILSIE